MGRARLEAFTLHQTVLGTVPSTVKCYSVNGAIHTHRHKGTNNGNDSEHFIMPQSLHFMIWLRLIDSESFLFNLHIFYNKLKPVGPRPYVDRRLI